MALKSHFNAASSFRELSQIRDQIRSRMINACHMAGLDFVRNSRGQPGNHAMGYYEDVTGNLRNSIGYFIYEDGVMIFNSQMGNLSQNVQEISHLIKSTGIQLIGIAGMNYASEVESRGYNVISIQADTCIVDLTDYVSDIQTYMNSL